MTSRAVVRVTCSPLSDLATQTLIVPIFEQDRLDDLAAFDAAAQGEPGQLVAGQVFRAKMGDVVPVSLHGWPTRRALLVGAGSIRDWSRDRLRRVAAAGAIAARGRGMARIAFVVRQGAAEDVRAAVEGLVLATYDGDVYKTTPRESVRLEEITVAVADGADAMTTAAERGQLLAECTNIARDLANEPGNRLSPRAFAERAASALGDVSLDVAVLDEGQIAALNMGLLLGVAQGSAEPPRVVVIRHSPSGAEEGPVLGLVGKGITFDTGGISIKPADGMDRMKTDMSGGAAVVAAMRAISVANAPVKVVGVVPAAENMPGGRAIRPGDVLTSASGKTVEVNNTDAEGRLILGDALWYAQQLGATHLVDVATLTGAVVVALGRHVSGLFGSEAWWVEAVRAAAVRAGDRVWPMPIYEEALEQMKSEIADIVNTGGRPGGACTAAAFLREFTCGRPWAHLDIAGTAWVDDPKPWQPKGTTGAAVRTLAELALGAAEWVGRGR